MSNNVPNPSQRLSVAAVQRARSLVGGLMNVLPARRFGEQPTERVPSEEDHPLRAELYSRDQLARHFRELSGWHRVIAGRRQRDQLLERLDDNERVLTEAYELIAKAVSRKRRIAPAAEWLLDNFYLIEEQIRIARRHFPKSYSRELPKLGNGPLAGFARVYALAYELIIHVDGRVDVTSLSEAVAAYQSAAPLKLGELWAVPIMLRLALIENLRRVGAIIAAGRRERDRADAWADRLLDLAEHHPGQLIVALAELSQAKDPLSPAFVAELARRIQGRHQALTLVVSWIEQRLSETGQFIEGLIQAENQSQAADQVSVGNSIGSLRFLGATDWSEFVEGQSVVEQTLRGDPADVYSDMDLATRDRYRHVVERIAKRGRSSEQEVAALAVSLASKGVAVHGDHRERHVGRYLIEDGVQRLEQAAGAAVPIGKTFRRALRRHALGVYLGAVLIPTLAASAWVLWQMSGPSADSWSASDICWSAALFLLALVVASQAAVSVVNWLCGVLVPPRLLPRLDYAAGIPSDHQTLVAVPCMLTSGQTIDDLIDGLEVRYVANRDPNLYLALITDFADADSEHMPDDEALVARARAGIEALNAKHAAGDRPSVFFLFHRPRLWNPREKRWMGRERKRGKLSDFNRALREEHEPGQPIAGFSDVVGDTTLLARIKHVITLDADTQLPMDAA
nr:cyclic beta 1-2 glucan synthetase [Planctomycetota bacterium]